MMKRAARNELVLDGLDRSGLGIELGPSRHPVAPKREGFNVHVIDHLDNDGLKVKLRNSGSSEAEIENVEAVDFVWNGESYADLIGARHQYDWVIASHVIEHVPDLAGFLQNCSEVLKDDGVLSLVVPDKRFCFDHFRPLSSLGSAIDAHLEGRVQSTPGTIYDGHINCSSLNGELTWGQGNGKQLEFGISGEDPGTVDEVARRIGPTFETHCWCWVPSSFELMVKDLNRLGYTDLHILEPPVSDGYEFFVKLGRIQSGYSAERLKLARQIQQEMYHSYRANYVLSPSMAQYYKSMRRSLRALLRVVTGKSGKKL